MSQSTNGSISISTILSGTFGLIKRNPVLTLGGSLVFETLPQVAFDNVFVTQMAQFANARKPLATLGLSLTSALFILATVAFTHAFIQRAALGNRENQPVSFSDCLGSGVRLILPLLGLYVLMEIGVILGFVLIIPGIIVALMWSVAGPVLVFERSGVFAAFRRSRFLTRGHRWKILGLFLVVGLCLLAIMTVIQLTLIGTISPERIAAMAEHVPFAYTLMTVFIGMLINSFFAALFANLYFALKEAKEGPEVSALAEVFA